MFNELFKKTMKQDKISGKELAARLGVPPANVSYYLQKGSWEESKMREYAAALGYELSISLVRRSALAEPTKQAQPPLEVFKSWYNRRNALDDYGDNITPAERDLWEQFKQALKDGREIKYTLAINN